MALRITDQNREIVLKRLGYDEGELTAVRYVLSPTRRIHGQVTGLNWGIWHAQEVGVMHVADAAMVINDGWVVSVDPDFVAKLQAYNRGTAWERQARAYRLRDVKYIGQKVEQTLIDNGIRSVKELSELTPKRLMEIADQAFLTEPRATEAIEDAKKLAGNE